MKGKLIIIEGLDGSGKSTQMQLLCQRAEQLGKPVRRVKFPNYDEDSSALVKSLPERRAWLVAADQRLCRIGAVQRGPLCHLEKAYAQRL